MHELGLARNIAAIVREHASGRAVKRVRLAIGPLVCVEKASLEYCWDLVAEGGCLAGSLLEFVDAEGDIFLVREYEMRETG